MNPDLEKLVELQKIDTEIKKLEKECEQQEKGIVALQSKIQTAQVEQTAAQEILEAQQKEHRRQERELEATEEDIKKHKNQLLNVKTNREYQALQHEIEEEEKAKDVVEEKILQFLETTDELQAELKESKEHIKLVEKEVAEETAEKQNKLNHLKSKLEKEIAHRTNLSKHIQSNLLAEYDKLLRKKSGLAVATVSNCICQGCFINIPPQDYEELKRGNKVYYCSSCSRILYWQESEAIG